jgi:hypothetical protein
MTDKFHFMTDKFHLMTEATSIGVLYRKVAGKSLLNECSFSIIIAILVTVLF